MKSEVFRIRDRRFLCFLALAAVVFQSTEQSRAQEQQVNRYRIDRPEIVNPKRAEPGLPGVIDEQLFTVFGTYTIPGKVDAKGQPTQIWTRAYQLQEPESPELTRRARLFFKDVRDAVEPPKAGIPGPTFEFRPGDFLRIRLHNFLNVSDNPWLNDLQNNLQVTQQTSDELTESATHEVNIPHGFNEVNLHVHGLHVDPKQDNVAVLILPQDGDPSALSSNQQILVQNINQWWQRRYQYKIPADHLPGTHWYHSHRHGATSIQVENGMAGALVIRPKNDQDDLVPGLCDTRHDRVLVTQEIQNFGVNGQGTGSNLRRQQQRRDAGARANIRPGDNSPVLTVNGKYAPVIQLPQGQVERWRFIVAGANHQQQSNIWVGKILFSPIPAAMREDLKGITKDNYQKYIPQPMSGGVPEKFFNSDVPLTFKFDDPNESKFDGSVNMVAIDGVTLSHAVPISAVRPTFGSSGNRSDLLVQSNDNAKVGSVYFVFKNYPSDPPPVQGLALAYPEDSLFADENGEWRYQALTKGKLKDKTTSAVNVVSQPPVIANIAPDPYNLGTDFTQFTVNWASAVQADGSDDGKGASQSLVPLLRGQKPADNIGPVSAVFAPPHAIDSTDPNGIIGVDQKWQPYSGAGAGVTNDYLMVVEIVKPEEGGLKYDDNLASLDAALSRISPTGDQANTKLTVMNRMGTLDQGIPEYVAPFERPVDFRRTVVFDKAGTTFEYQQQTTGNQSVTIQQFWIDGRQFSTSDFVGNPDATSFIRKPLLNEMPNMGAFNPTNGLWTNQIQPLIAKGQTGVTDTEHKLTRVKPEILNTNPGYYRPVKLVTKDGNSYYSYDYSTDSLPDYKSVTGFPDSRPPEATTSEEWLLVNNSDIYHPFHIHISPFFVEEVGQLSYDGSPAKWNLRKIIWDPVQKSVKWEPASLAETNKTFGWVVGNWWDTILIPPHGYVRFKTWINVPDQKPTKRHAPTSSTNDLEPDEWTVTEDANVFASWVFHCHILRHEDRGMMSMVAVTPRPHSLAGIWNVGSKKLEVFDDHGSVRVYIEEEKDAPENPTVFKRPYEYKGRFNEGIGSSSYSAPWVGTLNFAPKVPNSKLVPFCAAYAGHDQTPFQIVFSDGNTWLKDGVKAADKLANSRSLEGKWKDDAGNIATIKVASDQTTLSFAPEPEAKVWWKSGVGSWNNNVGDNPFQGKAMFRIKGDNPDLTPQLTFCVTKDLNTIIFSDGIRWRRESTVVAVESTRAPVAATSLKTTCVIHGLANMNLVFVPETGAARTIEIVGTNTPAKWTVTIDGADATPATQTSASPGQVKVHAGDKITWKVTGSNHGIVFPTQAAAEQLFAFDTTQGQTLGTSTARVGFAWGTAGFGAGTTLAVATVKPFATVALTPPVAEAVVSLKTTCVVHGLANMNLVFVPETGAARTIEIVGTNTPAKWTVTIDGADATPATQTSASPGQVKVHAGDKITWKVTGSNHGIVFPTQAAAEKLFAFDTAQGQTLGASSAKAGFTWGTNGFGAGKTLAVGTVKAQSE